MTTDAYKAAASKLEQIESIVKGIDFDYEELDKIKETKEELDSSLKKLEDFKKEVKRLKEQVELDEQELADVEGNFQKYQSAVDAGYDDNCTLALRDNYKVDLEEAKVGWAEVCQELENAKQAVTELTVEVGEWRSELAKLEEDFEPHPLDLDTPDENFDEACNMVLCTEYRSGWSTDKEVLDVTEVRLTLAIGGPSIFLTADYDDGEISNPKLTCVWWGDHAEITEKQDVLVRFLEYVNV
jgi:DNA repair ATPase RecN